MILHVDHQNMHLNYKNHFHKIHYHPLFDYSKKNKVLNIYKHLIIYMLGVSTSIHDRDFDSTKSLIRWYVLSDTLKIG